MLRVRSLAALLLCASAALATRIWAPDEIERQARAFEPSWTPRPESLIHGPRRYNYLQRIKMMADFVASYQVSDSGSPHFGGIIEAEDQPNVVETDNTQEAIWVWSRWYELTGRDDYATNIRRAWRYVVNYPAYWEHNGNPSSIWYAVWNCGLAFMAESKYRAVYGDTSYRSYADSCRGFYLRNPLDTFNYLNPFVTGQSSGMAYDYALETGDTVLHDSALTRGTRVQHWIEADAAYRLGFASWAMSGATAMWGVCHTVCRADTIAGRQWIETYADSLPGFYPAGTWNCSHNIWLANAYRACAETAGGTDCWLMHHYLVDTLLTKDTDLDGGIPATWTDPETRDQTWVSTYLDFMGMDVFVTPTYNLDASVLAFVSPDPRGVHITGDTLEVRVGVANVGLNPTPGFNLGLFIGGRGETVPIPPLGFLVIDTVAGSPFVLETPGICQAIAIGHPSGDLNPLNDSSQLEFKVYGMRTITGVLTDSATGMPFHAWLTARITGDSVVWDSAETDRSGNFTLRIIDTLVTISLHPWPPYYSRSWNLVVTGDTSISLVAQPAELMVVNNDPAEDYAEYYTSTLDTLDLTYFVWPRRTQGEPPWQEFRRLRTPTIIWYTGDAASSTVPEPDQDTLVSLARQGLNLLLTGQNIAEELAGTDFLEQFTGCSYDSSDWPRFFAFGDRSDSVGRTIYATATAGGSGAGNQDSRDMLSPALTGRSLIVYDTVGSVCAGTRNQPYPDARVILLGFGFEAVNRPVSRPAFLTRVEFLDRLLNWFELTTGVREPTLEPLDPRPRGHLTAWPNPFRNQLLLNINPTRASSTIAVYDIRGRLVDRVNTASGSTAWVPARLPPGVYFLSLPGVSPLRVIKTH